MNERERERPQRPLATREPTDPNEGEGIEDARVRAERLLQAADNAVARALSTDSERFLQATRQSSGQ